MRKSVFIQGNLMANVTRELDVWLAGHTNAKIVSVSLTSIPIGNNSLFHTLLIIFEQ